MDTPMVRMLLERRRLDLRILFVFNAQCRLIFPEWGIPSSVHASKRIEKAFFA
jgi:hypothetical protein